MSSINIKIIKTSLSGMAFVFHIASMIDVSLNFKYGM